MVKYVTVYILCISFSIENKGSIETKGSVQDSPAQREKEALSRDQVESKDIIEPRQDSSLEPAVDDHPVPSLDQEQKKIVKLHICATCQKKEETVKTFKRCQRCVYLCVCLSVCA